MNSEYVTIAIIIIASTIVLIGKIFSKESDYSKSDEFDDFDSFDDFD